MPQPIRYIERTRHYYQALGYESFYRWAQNAETPFLPPRPVGNAVVAIVTTAAPFDPEFGDQGPNAPYNASAKFYDVYACPIDPKPDLRISHVAYDRTHCEANDTATWLPLDSLKRVHNGPVSSHVFGLPTNRSQSTTLSTDSPKLVKILQKFGVGVAIFVPNCPVCHQSVSLAARQVEAHDIHTVVMGCAKDIVEQACVPRFVFSDLPLGHSAGPPNDLQAQDQTLKLALDLVQTAAQPTTVVSPIVWPGPANWRDDYSNPAKLTAQQLAARRAEFDKGKSIARSKRRATTKTPCA